MDNGTLTDSNGRKADFRHVIIVMTTNAGASDMERSGIGFTQKDHAEDGNEAIKMLFTPEFRNRLDASIQFSALDMDIVKRVVDKFIMALEGQLEERNVAITVSEDARAWLARNGYDRAMGARPMARLIQEHVKKPLADELLFGELANGGEVVITLKKDKLDLHFLSKSARVTS